MRLGFSDLLDADPGVFVTLADRWAGLADTVDQRVPDDHVTALRRVSATLQQAAVNFAAARNDARRIRRQAARLGMVVTPTGTISFDPGDRRASSAAVELIGHQLNAAVRAANEADQRAARAIGELTPAARPPAVSCFGDHVILVTGNPATARNIVIVVSDGADDADRVLSAVAQAALDSDPGAPTAAVWWAGRDAAELDRFLRGLPAAHVVLVHGHGHAVVGAAARLPGMARVDDVIVLDAPGVPEGHVRTDGKPTRFLFSAKAFGTGSYFTPGPALDDVGGIVTGRYPAVASVPRWERRP